MDAAVAMTDEQKFFFDLRGWLLLPSILTDDDIEEMKAEVYADVVMGKTKPEKAFMEGKITATNLGDMMKFGQAFDMKKAREIAEREKAAAAPAAAESKSIPLFIYNLLF